VFHSGWAMPRSILTLFRYTTLAATTSLEFVCTGVAVELGNLAAQERLDFFCSMGIAYCALQEWEWEGFGKEEADGGMAHCMYDCKWAYCGS